MRAVDLVAGRELVIAGEDGFPDAAPAVMELGLGQILGGNGHTFAVVQILDGATGDGVGHGFANLALEAAHESLPVHSTLVLAVEPAVDDTYHSSLPKCLRMQPAGPAG